MLAQNFHGELLWSNPNPAPPWTLNSVPTLTAGGCGTRGLRPSTKHPGFVPEEALPPFFWERGLRWVRRGGGWSRPALTLTNSPLIMRWHGGGGAEVGAGFRASAFPLSMKITRRSSQCLHTSTTTTQTTHTLFLKNRRNTRRSFVFFRSKVARTPLHSRRGQFFTSHKFFLPACQFLNWFAVIHSVVFFITDQFVNQTIPTFLFTRIFFLVLQSNHHFKPSTHQGKTKSDGAPHIWLRVLPCCPVHAFPFLSQWVWMTRRSGLIIM